MTATEVTGPQLEYTKDCDTLANQWFAALDTAGLRLEYVVLLIKHVVL